MAQLPNIILINCDDLGYGDLACYGSELNRTPHLDRMAAEGLRLTDFYMASPVCSPSRGGMLTGCYPNRIGFDQFDGHWVLFPGHAVGLDPAERSIARMLKEAGYATQLVGKWHCGDQPDFLPTRHGFDNWFGIPYSNDMGRQAGDRSQWIERLQQQTGVSYAGKGKAHDVDYPPLPLMDNERVLQEQPDQAALTERYVQECVRFMREQAAADQPFFLYLAHMYVHLPIYVPKLWLDRSQNGAYGAAVELVDWATGVLLDEVKRLAIDEDTLVIFTSDNGSRARGEGGSNLPCRSHKGTTWEGGQRLPCIVRWPGTVPAGVVSDQLAASIDFLPTFAALAGGDLHPSHAIDGQDLSAFWKGASDSPRDEFCYFHRGNLEAIRVGRWKLHFSKGDEPCNELYDLAADIGETTDRFGEQPAVVAALTARAEAWRQRLGDARLGIEGAERRPVGRVDDPDVLTHYDPEHPYIMAEYDLADAG